MKVGLLLHALMSMQLLASVQSKIYESTALMNMSWETADYLSLQKAFQIETLSAQYFAQVLEENFGLETQQQLEQDKYGDYSYNSPSIVLLNTQMDITNERLRNDHLYLDSIVVTITYASLTEVPISDLDTVLMHAMQRDPAAFPAVLAPTLGDTIAQRMDVAFRPYKEPELVAALEVRVPDAKGSRTAADKGLIVGCVLLSIMLVIVSSTLLHITGGWRVCREKISNCLLEEIDDDECDGGSRADTKPSFNVDSTSYGEDIESNAPSGVATEPSGMLGVNDINPYGRRDPTKGLGMIKTPTGRESGGNFSEYGGDSVIDNNSEIMTPFSNGTATTMDGGQPMGILSRRKMPQNNATPKNNSNSGGLTSMIMSRMNLSAQK